jgi:transcriptional regulator with XRE-family HTH domain
MSPPLPTKVDLAQAIRELRKAHGLTLDAMAAKAGMHTTYLSRIERAHSSPTWDKLTGIASALDLPISAVVAAAQARAERRVRDRGH